MIGQDQTPEDPIPGKWYVATPPRASGLTSKMIAGPFDTQEEAQKHLDTHMAKPWTPRISSPFLLRISM
jgi:hypothetical protein